MSATGLRIVKPHLREQIVHEDKHVTRDTAVLIFIVLAFCGVTAWSAMHAMREPARVEAR